MEPDVILMDEPLSNLDALLRLEMRAELKGVLAESKTTTIYVTHDQVEAMSLADRIAVMHQGRIVQAASPVEVYRNPAARFVSPMQRSGSTPPSRAAASTCSSTTVPASAATSSFHPPPPRSAASPSASSPVPNATDRRCRCRTFIVSACQGHPWFLATP
jgi:ABC-type sulfate/molybdate transport systems ATPase subunit